MRNLSLAASLSLLLTATAAAAGPTITAVTPSSGPVAGGIVVTIEGRDFGGLCIICSPPQPPLVFFGGVQATEVALIGPTKITAKIPAHIPGRVDVSVTQYDGTGMLSGAFEYSGPVDTAFERILLPLFTPPLLGAFGSEFRTAFEVRNDGSETMLLYGLQAPCILITTCTPPSDPTVPYPLPSGQTVASLPPIGTPGRLLYVDKRHAADLWANLRAYDVSRNALSFGSQIPIVSDADFREGEVILLGVPWDANFRNTLRIYSDRPDQATVSVSIGGRPPVEVTLAPGHDLFEPAYAMFTDFPPAPIPIRAPDFVATQTVEVRRAACTCEIPGANNPRIWAFVSATNNTTQEITTIAPR